MKTALREIRNSCSNGRCFSVWWSIMGREQEQLLNDKNSTVIYTLSDSHHGYEAAIMTTIPQKWLLYMYMLYARKHYNYMVRKPRAAGLSTIHLLDIEKVMWYFLYVKGNGKRLQNRSRNASWLYSLFWYPAVVAKGRYTLHIWYAGKSYNQLLIPCRSDMKLTSDWYQTVMHRVASGLIMAWPERGGVYDSWQMGSSYTVHA